MFQQQPSSSFMNYPPTAADFCFRKIMRQSVAAICKMSGFDFIQPRSLELLTQMMTCYFIEACRSSKALTEHGGRTIVNPTDVFLALVEMGTDMDSFNEYLLKLKTTGSCVIPPPRPQTQPQHTSVLKIGEKKPLPPHIPSFLPPFPDPHTYIKTEVSGEPDTTYEKMRILTATNKRNSEASLLKYLLSIHPCVSLYREVEERLRREAKLMLEHERNQKQLRLEALKATRERQKLQKELSEMHGDSVPENILDGDVENRMETDSGVEDDDKILKGIEMEELFRTKETENSLVRKRLPYYTTVFVPFPDKRPYLAALLSDENMDDEKNANEAGPSKLSDSIPEDTSGFVDNPYLQQPRMADVTGASPILVQDAEQSDQVEASELEDMPIF